MGAVPVQFAFRKCGHLLAPRIAASAAYMEGPSRSRAVAPLGPRELRSLRGVLVVPHICR